jgi:RNA polymerase sigma-70 factor (ECF subfamily)
MVEEHATSVRTRRTARWGEVPFAAVLAGVQDGAPWAFRQVVEWLGRPVAGYLRGQGAEDPDGLTNEVFLRAFRHVERFAGSQAQFRSWVFTLARNALIDERRRRSRRVPTLDLTNSGELASPRDAEPDAITGSKERVRELLRALTDDQREVLLLRVAADLPVEDVARVTGRSREAVRALQHRGLASLRRSLGT